MLKRKRIQRSELLIYDIFNKKIILNKPKFTKDKISVRDNIFFNYPYFCHFDAFYKNKPKIF